MAISIDPATLVIFVAKADLTLITGTFYELDTEAFRLELIGWEDGEIGMNFPRTHTHNTEVTVAGTTYARTIEILAPYAVEFEDGQYSVKLVGSNNNIFDVENGILVQNQVQVIPTNSAGLIVKNIGSGLDPSQAIELSEIHEVLGLDAANPVTHEKEPAAISSNNLDLDLTEDVDGNVTVQRS